MLRPILVGIEVYVASVEFFPEENRESMWQVFPLAVSLEALRSLNCFPSYNLNAVSRLMLEEKLQYLTTYSSSVS